MPLDGQIMAEKIRIHGSLCAVVERDGAMVVRSGPYKVLQVGCFAHTDMENLPWA